MQALHNGACSGQTAVNWNAGHATAGISREAAVLFNEKGRHVGVRAFSLHQRAGVARRKHWCQQCQSCEASYRGSTTHGCSVRLEEIAHTVDT